jgi:hypothetical protein
MQSIARTFSTMTRNWTHLVRFLAKEDGQVHLGQIDAKAVPDLGLALEKGESVTAKLISGSVFDGVVTDKSMTIDHVSVGLDGLLKSRRGATFEKRVTTTCC